MRCAEVQPTLNRFGVVLKVLQTPFMAGLVRKRAIAKALQTPIRAWVVRKRAIAKVLQTPIRSWAVRKREFEKLQPTPLGLEKSNLLLLDEGPFYLFFVLNNAKKGP